MGRLSSMIRPLNPATTPEFSPYAARRPARIPIDFTSPEIGRRPPVALILADPTEAPPLLESLQQIGAPVVVATNGAAGLRLIETERPAVIVVDLWLPVLNGLEVLRRRSEATPAFLIADFTSPGLRCEAVAARVLALIVRPLDPDTLCEQIRPYVHWVPRAGATIWAVEETVASRKPGAEPLSRRATPTQ